MSAETKLVRSRVGIRFMVVVRWVGSNILVVQGLRVSGVWRVVQLPM